MWDPAGNIERVKAAIAAKNPAPVTNDWTGATTGSPPQYLNNPGPVAGGRLGTNPGQYLPGGSANRKLIGNYWYNWNPGMQVWTLDSQTSTAPTAEPTTQTNDVTTGQQLNLNPGQALVHSQTARTLEALRQGLNRGQNQSGRYLRQGLAQRGMLDSGSLGAGLTRISGDTQGRLAAGTQSALTGESQQLLDLLKQEQDRQHNEKMTRLGWSNQMAMMNAQNQASQPEWYEQLLGGVGGSIPGLAYLLAGGGGNSNSTSGYNR